MKQKVKHIIISGGGTGGHLFPAIAIAQAIEKLDGTVNILFVGAKGKIEEEKVPALGYKIELLDISGFQRKLTFDNITFFIKLFKSLSKSRKIINKFKPDVAVGVGGYASGPLLRVAARKSIPYLLQEQNSYPGITNKLLAKKAQKICVAYDNTERFFPADKIIKTGNPVRDNLLHVIETKDEAKKFFGFHTDKKLILSLGGSGGAGTINDSIMSQLDKIIDSDVQLLWQTGKNYFERCNGYADKYSSDNIKVTAFISRMDLAYKAADLVISRAGAGTISELCLLGKPTILVPSPNVAEDHQTKNALALVGKKAAVLVTDKDSREKLIKTALELVSQEDMLSGLSQNIENQGIANSASRIAEEILKIINIKNN